MAGKEHLVVNAASYETVDAARVPVNCPQLPVDLLPGRTLRSHH
jgi:hypothetical protein